MSTEQERAAFKAKYGPLFDLTETVDAWGQPKFAREFVESIWHGWRDRAALQSQDAEDAERYRWLLEQAWFQEAFDRFDPDDGGSLPRFVSECARIIDHARRVEGDGE